MPSDLLHTCSPTVQKGVEALTEFIREQESSNVLAGPAYYVLEPFHPELCERFLDKLEFEDISLWEARSEYSVSLTFTTKVAAQHRSPDDIDILAEIRDYVASSREVDGKIRANSSPTVGPLWFLLQFDNIPVDLSSTIEYVASDQFITDYSDDMTYRTNLATGLICLSEVDHREYADRIEEMGKLVKENLGQRDTVDPYASCLQLLALNRTSIECDDVVSTEVDAIIQQMELNFQDSESEFQIQSIYDASGFALFLQALVTTGRGPKREIRDWNWEHEIERQDRLRSKSFFETTTPAIRLEERKIGIHDRAKAMIENAEDTLRISTLRIDLLHEELINKVSEDMGFDIQIVTSRSSATGERKKMKKAVMNELVKRTDGSVREDDLVHARMIITDDRELLVSSADLTRDQLYDEYNAGIYTRDPDSVAEAVELFEVMWNESEPRGVKN